MKRILLLLLIFTASTAVAQDRFDYVERHNPWNRSLNAAGIRRDTVSNSYADIHFIKENGGLMDYSSSKNSWTIGARTASIRHFNRLSFAGSFSYDYFDGEEMCGSMFVHPGYYPIDIFEFTPGRKIRENYAFSGAVSAVMSENWDLGARINFEAANLAKRKDLRHRNTRLDLEVMPGFLFHKGAWSAGAAYIYRKNNERVYAKEIGTSAESYDAFFDKGLSFGVLERWDGNGTHLDETGSGISGFPIDEQSHGAGIQLQYKNLFGEVRLAHRTGETGEKGVFWHDYEATDFGANLSWQIKPDHALRLNYTWTKLDNNENIFTREIIDGITTTIYYGQIPIFSSRESNLELEYELHKTDRWNMRADFGWRRTDRQSTLYFPYVKEQQMDEFVFGGDALFHLGKWELNGGVHLRKGDFEESEFEADSDLETDEYPVQLTDYYNYMNEYLTATRLNLSLGVRRNIHHFYVDLSAAYEHGFDLRYVAQPNRIRAVLSVGYNF